ncbi:WD40 repeat domain-containing protein [Jiella mangrovi]|uniref:WD40 repeat domain-containing protein n=1 Tax=Jiella mangrovi TaxID=2821407 RepID=A0ABS4BN69_9HYPH|nr:WD40 repeat domain-containing protein [Jiella mangrovi]MBP0618180.1 WD40 repeat domain-containing protein [Jiella mangrovi]
MKKGMVLRAPDAPSGEPQLHRFIVGAYTGAMAIAPFDGGGFVCNRFVDGEEEDGSGSDAMVHVSTEGEVTAGLALPNGQLVWKAAWVPAIGSMMLQVDGGVTRWEPGSNIATQVLQYRPSPGFLSVGGNRLACYDGSAAVVLDLHDGAEIMRIPSQPELYGGHSPQMEGALSRDGSLLALCAVPGEITVFDMAMGQVRQTLRGDFAMVRQMDFLPDGNRLLVVEQYGRGSLRCLDLGTGGPAQDWSELKLDGASIALSPSGSRLAVAWRDHASIHDIFNDERPRSFVLEHLAKRCAMAWIAEDSLAVRTDLGCASIYATP